MTEQDLANLELCAHAEILYLQDEYTNVLAENRYGPETARVMRDLQSNSTLFTTDRVDKLKAALELQAAHSRQRADDSGRGRGRGRGYGSYNRRGGYHGGYQGGFSRGRGDVFQNLTSRYRSDEKDD